MYVHLRSQYDFFYNYTNSYITGFRSWSKIELSFSKRPCYDMFLLWGASWYDFKRQCYAWRCKNVG